MEITGKIIRKEPTERFSETFEKQDIYLDCSNYEQGTGRKFENYVKIQFINAKIDLLNHINEGERVKVNFNIKGRFSEKDGQEFFFQNLSGYRIEKL